MAPPEKSVLPRADWERIQSSLNQPRSKVYTRQQMVESNARHQFFRAEDKLLKAQCRKQQATRQIEEQSRDEYLNRLAAEEMGFKKQDRQQVVDETNFKRFHQNDCVRKFNSAVLMKHVQKENEAVIALNQERQKNAKERKRQLEEEMRCRQNEALRQEQEKARQRQLYNQAVADHRIEQMKDNKQLREKERRQEKDERDRLRSLDELHAQELKHQAEKNAESRKRHLKYRREVISSRELHGENEAQKQNMEEKRRQHVQLDVEGKLQQRKNDQAEKFRKRQIPKEIVRDKLAVRKREAASTTLKEEAKLSKEVAEQDAAVAKQQKDKEEKRVAMLKSISAHRETKIQENEQKKKAEQQSNLDWLQTQKQSDRLFLEEKKLQAKRTTENKIKCQAANVTLKAENRAHLEQLKREERDAEEKNAEQTAEREKQVQQYVQSELHKAADVQQNVPHPLAARTGGHGIIFDREQPAYYCGNIAEKLPRYGTEQTRLIKSYHERNSLQLGMVDLEPARLPPLSRAAKLKVKDALAAKKEVYGWPSSTAGVEGSHCCSKDTSESLLTLGTAQTRSTKHYLDSNKLQLVYEDAGKVDLKGTCLPPISNTTNSKNSKVDLQPTRLPPISTKETPAGRRCPPAGVKDSPYRFKESGESLLTLGTAQTRSTKHYLDSNKLQLVYEDAGKVELKRTCLPPISNTTNSKNSKVDLQPTCLPPISTKETPAGRRSPPAGVKDSPYRFKESGESLPRLSTAQTRHIKQRQDNIKLQFRMA